MGFAQRALMPFLRTSMSRSWAWPVASLVILAAGCTRAEPQDRLVSRTEQALADLERLRPRMAKAGTPGAEELADQLGAVREGLATLPIAPVVAATEPPPPPPPPVTALVRCPDEGCWRLGVQAEVGAWRLRLTGGGQAIDDMGPPGMGLAVAMERARPIDHRLEWSWGVEGVGSIQDRTGGQSVILIGVRPVIRAALAVHEAIAITARPIIEVGQASVRLGSEPGDVIDQAGVYGALGLRAGMRMRLATGGDLTAELGWREVWFSSSAGSINYRTEISSPELAIGWAGRF
jgi:hypothetical protein